jgi:hypothetical protein
VARKYGEILIRGENFPYFFFPLFKQVTELPALLIAPGKA